MKGRRGPRFGKKVLVVCGFHHGGGLEEMWGILKMDDGWPVYGFEPNPSRALQQDLRRAQASGVVIHDSAVWTLDGRVSFHAERSDEGAWDGDGSSVLADFDTGKERDTSVVDCVDFVKWLDRTTGPEDTVYIRMNIEGAEYPVLRHMLANKACFANIATMWVSFHEKLVPGESQDSTTRLIQDVRQHCNLKMLYYHA